MSPTWRAGEATARVTAVAIVPRSFVPRLNSSKRVRAMKREMPGVRQPFVMIERDKEANWLRALVSWAPARNSDIERTDELYC